MQLSQGWLSFEDRRRGLKQKVSGSPQRAALAPPDGRVEEVRDEFASYSLVTPERTVRVGD